MDLLSITEQECAIVAQDSPSSEDLDDSTVTFGQQNSEKPNFEKIHYESLFEQESRSEEEMSYNIPGRTANETPHIAEHPGEKIICREQSMWLKEGEEKTAFGGELNEKYHGQTLINKESGEDDFFGSTDKNNELQESNLTIPNSPFIDQEMDYETTIKMMK